MGCEEAPRGIAPVKTKQLCKKEAIDGKKKICEVEQTHRVALKNAEFELIETAVVSTHQFHDVGIKQNGLVVRSNAFVRSPNGVSPIAWRVSLVKRLNKLFFHARHSAQNSRSSNVSAASILLAVQSNPFTSVLKTVPFFFLSHLFSRPNVNSKRLRVDSLKHCSSVSLNVKCSCHLFKFRHSGQPRNRCRNNVSPCGFQSKQYYVSYYPWAEQIPCKRMLVICFILDRHQIKPPRYRFFRCSLIQSVTKDEVVEVIISISHGVSRYHHQMLFLPISRVTGMFFIFGATSFSETATIDNWIGQYFRNLFKERLSFSLTVRKKGLLPDCNLHQYDNVPLHGDFKSVHHVNVFLTMLKSPVRKRSLEAKLKVHLLSKSIHVPYFS